MKNKFKMNNKEWTIEVISNDKMNTLCGSNLTETFTHGATRYSELVIYLNELAPDKRKTLYHELTHCFMQEFGHNQHGKEFNNEDVCEISACSHDIIHKIVEDYFGGKE